MANLPILQNAVARRNWSCFYSSFLYTVAAGTLSLAQPRWFSTQIAQTGAGFPVGLSIAETNVKTAGQISAQQGYVIHGVAFKLSNALAAAPVSAADAHNILDGAVAEFDWSQSRTMIAPLGLIGSGGDGLYGVAGTVGATAAELTIGAGAMWIFRNPIILAPLATMNIVVTYPNTANCVKVAPTTSIIGRFTLVGELTTLVDAG